MFNFFKNQQKARRLRKFEAAIDNRLLNWVAAVESADKQLQDGKLTTLRNKARELVQNNEFAKRYLQILQNNVVGAKGIMLDMDVRDLNGTKDEAANQLILREWKKFCKSPTTSGRLSMVDLQAQALCTTAKDGEVFYQYIYNRTPQHFALFPIEADHVPDNFNVDTRQDGSSIRMGVEKNALDQVIQYHVSRRHPGDSAGMSSPDIKIAANDMLHVYKSDRVRDSRGYTWMAQSIITLKHLNEYFKTELVASRLASAKAGFFTREEKTDGVYKGDREDEAGNMIMDVAPGSFTTLPVGVKLQTFDPQNPHSNFDTFTKTLLRKVASGFCISYNMLTSDLESVNYSSLRAGALEDREYFAVLQQWLIEHFLQPTFEKWLYHKLERGDFVFPGGGKLPVTGFDKFNAPVWRARKWPWVDPQKDIQAAVLAIDNGIRSRGDVISENYGGEHADTVERIATEKSIEESLGLNFGENDKQVIQETFEPNEE